MNTAKRLSLILALTMGTLAGGCAASSPDGDDDGGGGGGGGGGGDGEQRPMDASGKYQLRSTFDLATNAPGKVGDVVNAIIDATNQPEDPTLYIVERVIDAMPSGPLKTGLNAAKSFVAGYLNQRLLDLAPDFFSTMVQLGQDFGQIAKNFGLNETLEVAKGGAAYTSTHTVLGAHFKVDNVETDHNFADHNVENLVINNVAVTYETGKLGIADHKVAVSYGKVLRIGLDAALIPMLDPTATNLQTLLAHKVNCQAIGQAIADALGFGGASAFSSACSAGLVAGANYIYGKIADIDGTALELSLTGSAQAVDKNADRSIDTINTGAWTGSISYAGNPAALSGATFFGSRM